ncbi:hypothetical protein ACOMHN_039623 [Nucella lapillus]
MMSDSQSSLMASGAESCDVTVGNSQQALQSQSQSSSLLPADQVQIKTKENLEDYETQLFGFTPKSFVSGIYNAVSEYFMEALQILEDYLQRRYGDTMTGTQVAERMTIIRKHLVTQIDKAFDTLEIYLATNIFCVPKGLVLPEDQVQMDSPVSEQDFLTVQRDIQSMKNNILAVKLANAVLKQRLQHTMELQETMDHIVQRLSSAHTAARQEGVVDLRDSLSHCAQTVLGILRLMSRIHDLHTQEGPSPSKKLKTAN